MSSKNPKRSMDSLATQLGIPTIDMTQDQINSLVKAGEKVRYIAEFIEYLNNHKMYLASMSGNGIIPMPESQINEMVLDYVGISRADAEKAADYVVNTIRILLSRGL